MILRQYQTDYINAARRALTTSKSPVLVLPCGAGKSVICGHIAKLSTDKKLNALFVVHRIELVDQIKQTFEYCEVDFKYCDISMIQSAHKLEKDYNLIITDESHHATASTYKRLYDRYPNAYRINVTATPCRTDGRGLGETCDNLIELVTTKWLIDNNFLAPYKYFGINLLSVQPKKVRGEYEDLTESLSKPKIYGDIFKYYNPESKTIIYASSLAHSIKTVEEFKQRGYEAAHIDGTTPKDERKQIIEDFRTGKIKVLSNYSLLGEGFDVPDCDTVMLLRKTTSLCLFIQMSMRCMRYQPNKIAYIYDFCGNCFEHGLPDDTREWSLDPKVKVKKNESDEVDVLVRSCGNCFRAYPSQIGRICPFCGYDNGKTIAELKTDKQAELVEIQQAKKEEVKNARTLAELIKIGKERGYKNPHFWARKVFYGSDRQKKGK